MEPETPQLKIENQPNSWVIILWLPIVWVAVFATGNFFVPILASDDWLNINEEMFYSTTLGLLVAQSCLLGIWFALGNQNFMLRASVSGGVLFMLTCVFLVALNMVERGMPLEVPLMCVGLSVIVMLSVAVPLWVFRVHSGSFIALPDANSTMQSTNQFGIKHLLIATTVAALMIGLAQIAIPQSQLEGDAPWGEIIAFCVSLNLLITIVALLSTACVFISRRRILFGVCLFSAVLLGPLLVASFLVEFAGSFRFSETTINTMAFGATLAVALLLVLASYYGIGFRLLHEEKF